MHAYSSIYKQTLNGTPSSLPPSAVRRPTLPTNLPGRQPARPELLFPRSTVTCALPTSQGSARGQGTTYLRAKQEQHLLAKTSLSNESTCSSRVSLSTSAKLSRSRRGFAQQPLFQPEPGTPRGVNSPRALGSIAETSC